MTTSNQNKMKKLNKKDLRGIFWRTFPMEASFNYERMMSAAFAYLMTGVIRKLYSNPEDQKAAMKRHLEFFNCTSAMSPLLLSLRQHQWKKKG